MHDDDGPVAQVNELEWVAGEIYANVWQTDTMLRISPADGQGAGARESVGTADAMRIARGRVDVLNGIAYDAAGKAAFRHREMVAEAVRDPDHPQESCSEEDEMIRWADA